MLVYEPQIEFRPPLLCLSALQWIRSFDFTLELVSVAVSIVIDVPACRFL